MTGSAGQVGELPQDRFALRLRGLCGAGKTTLARRLAPILDAKIFEIGRYRRRFREEPMSWELMVADIESHLESGGRAIVPTTGLNRNEYRLDTQTNAPVVWIDADLETLDLRVRSKPFWERGYFNWFGPAVYRGLGTKYEFNRKSFMLYQAMQTQGLRLDAVLTPEEMGHVVCDYLQGLGYQWPGGMCRDT